MDFKYKLYIKRIFGVDGTSKIPFLFEGGRNRDKAI